MYWPLEALGLPPDSGITIEFHNASVPPAAKNWALTDPPVEAELEDGAEYEVVEVL